MAKTKKGHGNAVIVGFIIYLFAHGKCRTWVHFIMTWLYTIGVYTKLEVSHH